MSEADNHDILPLEPDFSANNGYLNENSADSMQTEEINQLFSTSDEVVNFFDELFPSDPDPLTTALETLDNEDIPANLSSSLPDDPLTQNGDGFILARQLREKNQDLIKTVVQLEQALTDSQEQLQSQVGRSHRADTLIAQQVEELNQTQQEVTHLLGELETAQQTIQNQQLFIDNLAKQLAQSQGQVAQLERECALLQENYNDHSQKLEATEQQTRELRSRLHRQQRYTLQYKAALDQCLGVSATENVSNSSSENPIISVSLTPKVSSIPPWSIQSNKINSLTDQTSIVVDQDLPDDVLTGVKLEIESEMDTNSEIKQNNLILEPENNEIESENTQIPIEMPSDEPSLTPQTTEVSTSNYPSHVISKQRKPRVTIDLPSFLRNR